MLAAATSHLSLGSLTRSNETWTESEQWSKSKQWSGTLAASALFSCHLDAMLVVVPAFKLPWKPWEISEDVFTAKPGGGFHDPSPCFIGPDAETRPQGAWQTYPPVCPGGRAARCARGVALMPLPSALSTPCGFVSRSALPEMLLSRFLIFFKKLNSHPPLNFP